MSSSNSLLLSDVELKGKITEKDDIILAVNLTVILLLIK